MQLTFDGTDLGDILAQMRRFLDSLPGDAAVQGLVNLDGPLPPAVKRAPKNGPGAAPTPAEIEAARDAEAPPCTADDVRSALRSYIQTFGEDAAMRYAPKLMGVAKVPDIPETKLWRAKVALEAAIFGGDPAG